MSNCFPKINAMSLLNAVHTNSCYRENEDHLYASTAANRKLIMPIIAGYTAVTNSIHYQPGNQLF